MQNLLTNTVEQYFEAVDFELVDFKSISRRGGVFLRIVIDRPGGVTIDDCTKVHKELSLLLRASGIDDFGLEVTSPGPRRLIPIGKIGCFVDQPIRIVLTEPIKGLYVYTGVLSSVWQDYLVLELEKEDIEIKFEQIKRINLWR